MEKINKIPNNNKLKLILMAHAKIVMARIQSFYPKFKMCCFGHNFLWLVYIKLFLGYFFDNKIIYDPFELSYKD